MVNITTFKPKKHMEVLLEMHQAQNYSMLEHLSEGTTPKIGFIAYSNREYQYIAAGFLRMVEGGYAQLDTFVTNPAIEPYLRNEAIDMIVSKLLEKAKSLELIGVYAISADKSILKRAEDTGFHVINQSIIALKLRS